jgi:hypothetical protein
MGVTHHTERRARHHPSSAGPHRLLQDWRLDADGVRREGHAALFSLLAAAR